MYHPITWGVYIFDEIAIISYLVGSTLYLFLPLIPDLAVARDHTKRWRKKLYRVLALGWQGTETQWRNLQLAINVFAFVIIPVMFSVSARPQLRLSTNGEANYALSW